jgi:hypothetical protein
MSKAKKTSRGRRPGKTLPVLGAAGVSLALANGAQASVDSMTTEVLAHPRTPGHEITLCEEDVSGISLATFGLFDKKNLPRMRVAACACACGTDFYPNSSSGGEREPAGQRRSTDRAQPYARPKPPPPPANQIARPRPQPETHSATAQGSGRPAQSNTASPTASQAAAKPAQSNAASPTASQGAGQQGGPELSGSDTAKSSN